MRLPIVIRRSGSYPIRQMMDSIGLRRWDTWNNLLRLTFGREQDDPGLPARLPFPSLWGQGDAHVMFPLKNRPLGAHDVPESRDGPS